MTNVNLYGMKGGVGTTTIAVGLALATKRELLAGTMHAFADHRLLLGQPWPDPMELLGTYRTRPPECGPWSVRDGLYPFPFASWPDIAVVDNTYLAIRHALMRGGPSAPRPDGFVVLMRPGLALTSIDVSSALTAPVLATITWDPAVARTIDAGLFHQRPPRLFRNEIDVLATAIDNLETP